MAVNLKIAVEVVDLRRAEKMMDLILTAIEKEFGSGDKAKLGYERKAEVGRRKRTVKDDVEWVYGEDRPELKELGFVSDRPMDALMEFGKKFGADLELISRDSDGLETRSKLGPYRDVLDLEEDDLGEEDEA